MTKHNIKRWNKSYHIEVVHSNPKGGIVSQKTQEPETHLLSQSRVS